MEGEINYILSYRKVKHPRIEVYRDAVKVIVPRNSSMQVDEFVKGHLDWIKRKIDYFRELENIADNLSFHPRDDLKGVVDFYIRECIDFLGVSPRKVFFRKMRKYWGSCNSKKGHIIFNKDLIYLPDDLVRYVVIHEMCHLVEGNHSKRFWQLVEKLDRDFREKGKLLTCYRIKLDKAGSRV
jgi:predicted metal-dependent hydrolase